MRKLLFASLLLLCAQLTLAQVKQVTRKDFEADEEGRDYVTVVGEFGILMHGPVETPEKGKDWNITRYDTDLEEKSSVKFPIPDKFDYSATFATEDNKTVHYLFEGRKGAFQIVSYDVKSGSTKSVPGTFPAKFYVHGLKICGSNAFITGMIKKQTVLLKVDLESGQGSNVQLPHSAEKISIRSFQVLEKEKRIALVTEHGGKKMREMNIHILDENGEPETTPFKISKDLTKKVLTASLTWLSKNHYIISGTYTTDKDTRANGIYITEFKDGEQSFIKYNSFTDLKNFTEYLSKRRKDKVDKKIEKKKAKGNHDYVEAYVLDHPVFEYNGEYVYIGEVYYPTYRTEYYTSYVNGKPVTSTRQVFDGYQYTHSTVIGMDKAGVKKWDFCFEMWMTYKPFYLKRFVKGVITDTDLKLIFTTGTNFRALSIKNGEFTEKDLGKIDLLDENEKLKYAGNVNTEYWYSNYFISYGTKRVKEEDEKGKKKKKTIFYMVKIKYE